MVPDGAAYLNCATAPRKAQENALIWYLVPPAKSGGRQKRIATHSPRLQPLAACLPPPSPLLRTAPEPRMGACVRARAQCEVLAVIEGFELRKAKQGKEMWSVCVCG